MQKAKIVEKTFKFGNLSQRRATNRIIIHHTGGADIDAYAEQIHQWHLNNGWSGIGYHFVIRKDGTIERGRPIWAVGSHAYGANSDSIGIHLSGEFTYNTPTEKQIESLALLIANLCEEYKIPVDRKHIIGHRETMATDCPGNILFNMLGMIVEKAKLYKNPKPDVVDKPAEEPKFNFKPKAGMLSEHFAENEFFNAQSDIDKQIIQETYARVSNNTASPADVMVVQNYFSMAKSAFENRQAPQVQRQQPKPKTKPAANNFPRTNQISGSTGGGGISQAALAEMLQNKDWNKIPPNYQKILLGL